MSSFSADVSFKLNTNKLETQIANALRNKINVAFQKAKKPIGERMVELVKSLIKESDTYRSLLTGSLRVDLGIKTPEPDLLAILDAIADTLQVDFVKYNRSLDGKFSFSVIKSDFSELLRLNEAKYISIGRNGQRYDIDWLEWILLEGDRIIITDYRIKLVKTKVSRTEQALMVPSGSWRVPPQFAGTQFNNFITKALDDPIVKSKLKEIFESEIKLAIK